MTPLLRVLVIGIGVLIALRSPCATPRAGSRDVLFEAWPAEPRILERLLGGRS